MLFYSNAVIKAMTLLKQGIPIAIIDYETTGLSAKDDYPFEIAGLKLIYQDNQFKIVDKICEFIKPQKELSAKITEVTGFTNSDLQDKPSEKEVFPKIKTFLDGCILCAHNAKFEKPFTEALYQRNGAVYEPAGVLCTLMMSKDLFRGESHKLCNMAAKYGLDKGVTFHDARADVTVTTKLLLRLFGEYSEKFKEPEPQGLIPEISNINFWQGKRHDMQRLYVNTNLAELYFDQEALMWHEKTGKDNILSQINIDALEQAVLQKTHCSDLLELAKFQGSISC